MGKKSRGNGEGTIYKREIHGKTKWCAEYTLQYCDRNGKRKKKQSLEILDKKLRKN